MEVTQGELRATLQPGSWLSPRLHLSKVVQGDKFLPSCKLLKLVFDENSFTAFHLTRILLSVKENQGRIEDKSIKPL